MRHPIYLCLTILAIVLSTAFLGPKTIPESAPPPLYLQAKKNEIIDPQTGKPLILRGITSDYFRDYFNKNYPERYGGLLPELTRIDKLKQAGANINLIGLYFAQLAKIKQNLTLLDAYVNYALTHGMYVYFAPAGGEFIETNTPEYVVEGKDHFKNHGPNDLAELTELLAQRYGSYPNTLFMLTAEPRIPPEEWKALQQKLAEIVRKHTKNPIIASTSYYGDYTHPVLTFDNIIYSTGGYVSKDNGPSPFPERKISQILGSQTLIENYPVIVAEFGGNYGGDFSSSRDLELFKNILREINAKELSYSAYRLSSSFENDGLALFDTNGNLTAKGKIFVESFGSTP